MKKSLLAFLLACELLLSMNIIWAEEPIAESSIELTAAEATKIDLLYKMGIIERPNVSVEPVTRGEFATWVANLSGLSNCLMPQTSSFEDVSTTNKYAESVAIVSAIGCMNGISETEFGVKKEISQMDATIALLRLMGYEAAARQSGGYPTGYMKYAASLKLNKDIDVDEENDRVAILLMCYNSLTTPFVDTEGEISKDNTLLGKVHNIYETKGTITANRFTCLDTEKIRLKTDEIEIDNVIYISEDVSLAEHIGEYVSCYYFYNEKSQERFVIYMKVLSNHFEKLMLTDKKILSAKNNVITYENEDGKTEQANMRAGFDFVLNNRIVMERTTNDLDLADGELTLIDADNDGLYELAKAKSIETMVYQGADNLEDLIYCKEGNIYTNPYNKSYYCEIIRVDEYDGLKKSISIDELVSGDMLTVYRSKDEKYLQIYAISSGIYGLINEISDEEIVINGTVYDLPLKTPRSELSVGADATFSTDIFGRLVYLDSQKDNFGLHYGYFFAFEQPKGLGSAKVKILEGDEKLIYPLSQKISIDDTASYSGRELDSCGALFESGKVKRQLVRYCVNAKGEITSFYTASGYSENSIKKAPDTDKNIITKYYQWRNIWGGKYVLPTDNFFMVIPTVDDEPNNEKLYGTSYSFGTDVNNCYVEIFDVNEDMEAGAVLLYSHDPLEGAATTTCDTSVGIVVMTTKGAENDFVYLWAKGETKSYEVNGDNIPSLEQYAFGDIVRYVVAKDGKISTLYKVLDLGTTGESTPTPTLYQDSYDYHFFGRVYKKLDDYLVLVPNYENSDYDSSIENRVVVPNAYGTCAVVDVRAQRVVTGSFDSISQYFDDDGSGGCYVYTRIYKWTNAKEIIIYKF